MRRVLLGAGVLASLALAVGLALKLGELPNQLLLLGGAVAVINLVCLPLALVGWVRIGPRFPHKLTAVIGAILAFFVAPAVVLGRTTQPLALIIAGALLLVLALFVLISFRASQDAAHRIQLKRACVGVAVLLTLLLLNTPLTLQLPDRNYTPPISAPEYPRGKGPVVLFDEGHHNFHTIDDKLWGMADLLRRDGYRTLAIKGPLTASALAKGKILVIANALHEKNVGSWELPTPSAFTEAEMVALTSWVRGGGSLFLLTDHMPFPGAAQALGKALGFELHNGFNKKDDPPPGRAALRDAFSSKDRTLRESKITKGRRPPERVSAVMSFVGSAFPAPSGATPVLVFGPGNHQRYPTAAWELDGAKRVSIAGFCQGAVRELGEGRVAVFTETAMFTTQLMGGLSFMPHGMNAPDASQNFQLLLNVIHWLDKRIP